MKKENFKSYVNLELQSKVNQLNREFNLLKKPFKYIVIDNFLVDSVAKKLHDNFPNKDSDLWIVDYDDKGNPIKFVKDNPFEKMLLGISKKENFPKVFDQIFEFFNTNTFLDFICNITGIENLVVDKTGRYAGLRGMLNESIQLVHSDAVLHPVTGLEKRITCLIYLNEDWDLEKGGCLEIWNDNRTKIVEKILPIFNRMVIFECTKHSYHGVPEEVKIPIDDMRKSIIWAYMTKPQETNIGRVRAKFVPTKNNKFSSDMIELSEERTKINSKAKFRFKQHD